MVIHTKRKAFTFFELIVAVVVVSLVLPAIFSIIFIILRQQLVLFGYREIKKQGDTLSHNITQLISERAIQVTDETYTAAERCPLIPTPSISLGSSLYLLDADGVGIDLFGDTQVASYAANTSQTAYLTSSDVTVSGLSFTCYRTNAYSPSVITVSYTVNKTILQRSISLQYRLKTQLKPYSY